MRELDQAIETFVRGMAFAGSFTHPYVPTRVGRCVWVVRDAERKRAADYRREEWVVRGMNAREVDALARAKTRGRFCIVPVCATDEDETQIRAGYKQLGYRLHAIEPLMVHSMHRIPSATALPSGVRIERVLSADLAERLRKAAGRRAVRSEHLRRDAPVRQYVALMDDRVIGWVKSITFGTDAWVSNMYVQPKHRRRGIGTAMLVRMLRDDRTAKVKRSVLSASRAGSMLYERVGYQTIGELLAFTPPKL